MSRSVQPAAEPTPATILEVRVLGPLEVLIDGQALVVDTRKALAILALLAVDARPFAREELAAMLWPESDDESARGALRRTLSVLRAALANRWLTVDRAMVTLDPDVRVDLRVLEVAVRGGNPDRVAAAADLARGPFLSGFSLRDSPEFDDWRATRSVAIERLVATLLASLATAAEERGDLAGATAAAGRQVELDPIDEAAQRRLISLLARSGDRTAAIRQYRSFVAVLERELGVAPLAETTELYEAVRDDRIAALPRPGTAVASALVPARLPMVGRDAALATLLERWRAARPDGRVTLVAGEAGIGKTRLLEELVAEATAAGGRSLAARAFASEDGIAYAPIVELLRAGLREPDAADRLEPLTPATLADLERVVPLPARLSARATSVTLAPADPPAARARLLEAVASVLTALVAGPLPSLILVEDVQWLDEASREALGYLARRLAGRDLLLVLAFRPEDLDRDGAAFVERLTDLPAASTVTLGRLARDDIERLLEAAARTGLAELDAGRLTRESEGLPLYVVEAVAAGPEALGTGVPRGVRALLRERLAVVGEAAGQVLSAAAVIGRSFELPTLRAASGRSEDETVTALEELVRRGIVREVVAGRGSAFDFAHARLREAAYERTSLARRRLLHRRVAEALRAEPGGRDDPGRLALIAGHLRAAGHDAEAADAYHLAGSRARAVYANEAALAHFQTAIALGHPDVADLQVEIGELLTARGDYAGAVAAFEAAAALVPEPALPGVELRLGRVHARRGDLATAASHLEAAIAGMDQSSGGSDAGLLARTLVERAVVALRGGDRARASETAQRALALSEAAADDAARAAAHRILGLVARDSGDLAAARAQLQRSLALAEDRPDGTDDAAAIAARNALALVEAAGGNHAAAIELLEQALEACRRTGERHLEAAVENNLADQLHAVGRPDDAMAHLKQAVAIFADVGGTADELEPEIWKLVAW